MDHNKIRDEIRKAWAVRYPDDKLEKLDVTVIVDKVFGGALASIRSKNIDEAVSEEIVYILSNYNVKLFSTTEELASFLQAKSRFIFVDVLSDASFISGVVFISLILIVFYIGFRPDGAYNKEAFIALTSVLGAAAGFFFGTKKQQ